MKILLCNPPFRSGTSYGVRAGSRWPHFVGTVPQDENADTKRLCIPYPFYLGYATGMLKSKGYEAKLIDSIALGDTYDKFFSRVDEYNPDLVLFEIHEPSMKIDLNVARTLKKRGYEVCLAGVYATVDSPRLLSLPYVDYILRGEYESNVLDMLESGEKRIYDYKLVKDLNSLPYPYRDDATACNHNDLFGVMKAPQLQIWASRGCPYRCTFCIDPPIMYQWQHRVRTNENVIGEIHECLDKWRFNSVYFDDDTFNIGDQRIQELSVLMKENFPDMIWGAMCRADTSTDETFRAMAKNNCVSVKFGIESGNQAICDSFNKQLDLNRARHSIKLCKELGMTVHLTFIHRNEKELEYNRKFREETKPDSFQEHWIRKFKGTKIHEENVGSL